MQRHLLATVISRVRTLRDFFCLACLLVAFIMIDLTLLFRVVCIRWLQQSSYFRRKRLLLAEMTKSGSSAVLQSKLVFGIRAFVSTNRTQSYHMRMSAIGRNVACFEFYCVVIQHELVEKRPELVRLHTENHVFVRVGDSCLLQEAAKLPMGQTTQLGKTVGVSVVSIDHIPPGRLVDELGQEIAEELTSRGQVGFQVTHPTEMADGFDSSIRIVSKDVISSIRGRLRIRGRRCGPLPWSVGAE
jgi:hypothetical protein